MLLGAKAYRARKAVIDFTDAGDAWVLGFQCSPFLLNPFDQIRLRI